MKVQLPYDVVGEVIKQLDDEASLRSCSLICKAASPLCQRQIFYEIRLEQAWRVRRFADLLEKSSHIASWVRVLALAFGSWKDVVEYAQSLLQLKRLHSLKLDFQRASSYQGDSLLEDLKPILLHLLSLPTILIVELDSTPHYYSTVYKLSGVFLAHSPNLEALVISSIELESPNEIQRSFVGPPLRSLELRDLALGKLYVLKEFMAKHILNLSRLKALKIDGSSKEEKDVLQYIIQSCAPTLQILICSSCALRPLQLGGMSGLPSLRIFNLTLRWETAWVGKSRHQLQKLSNQHTTNPVIEGLCKVLSDCPNLNEIHVSVRFGNTSAHDSTKFYISMASVVDWKRCLRMCKLMDNSLSRPQPEKLRLVSFTFHMESLEVGGDGVVVRRSFPFLSARGILRVSAFLTNHKRPILYVELNEEEM